MKITSLLCAALLIISATTAFANQPNNIPACAYQADAPYAKDAEEYKDSLLLAFENAATQCRDANAPEYVVAMYETLSEKAACDDGKCRDLNKEYRALFNHHWCGYQEGMTGDAEKKMITEAGKKSIKQCKAKPEHDWLYSKLMSCYHQHDEQCVLLGDGIGSVYSPAYVE